MKNSHHLVVTAEEDVILRRNFTQSSCNILPVTSIFSFRGSREPLAPRTLSCCSAAVTASFNAARVRGRPCLAIRRFIVAKISSTGLRCGEYTGRNKGSTVGFANALSTISAWCIAALSMTRYAGGPGGLPRGSIRLTMKSRTLVLRTGWSKSVNSSPETRMLCLQQIMGSFVDLHGRNKAGKRLTRHLLWLFEPFFTSINQAYTFCFIFRPLNRRILPAMCRNGSIMMFFSKPVSIDAVIFKFDDTQRWGSTNYIRDALS